MAKQIQILHLQHIIRPEIKPIHQTLVNGIRPFVSLVVGMEHQNAPGGPFSFRFRDRIRRNPPIEEKENCHKCIHQRHANQIGNPQGSVGSASLFIHTLFLSSLWHMDANVCVDSTLYERSFVCQSIKQNSFRLFEIIYGAQSNSID